MRAGAPAARAPGQEDPVDRFVVGLAAAAALVHSAIRACGPQGLGRSGRRVRAGGGQMVQPSARLWLRQAARRTRRRGRVRAHGDGAQRPFARASAGPAAGGAGRAQRQGADGDRASRRRRLGALAAAAVALIACSPQAPAQNAPIDERAQTGLAEVPLTIRSGSAVHPFTVEVAATPEQQERGLMFVRSLPPNRGMIFPYNPPQDVSFWMKNTLIPLDIIFIRSDGSILRIANAKPLDETAL